MKQCPVCQCITFDDASTCFGCMHGFASGPDAPDDACVASPMPSFVITLTPEQRPSGQMAWTCAVDVGK